MKYRFRMIVSSLFLITILLLLFSYAMFQGGFVSWFLFFSFLPILLYEAVVLLYPIRKWQVSRKLSHYITNAGGAVTVKVKIKRRFPFPLYYCIIEDMLADSLKKVDNGKEKYQYMRQADQLFIERRMKRVLFPGFKRTFSFSYRLEQIPRGVHSFPKVRIRTGDFFGLVKKDHIYAVNDSLVASPIARPFLLEEQIRNQQEGNVLSSSLRLNNANVATGIREYLPGDRVSWIDWKQTARKNTMMTKEFEQERGTSRIIVLEACNISNPIVFEGMVEVTYALLTHFKKQSLESGLLTVGKDTSFFASIHAQGDFDRLKEHITKLQPSKNDMFSMGVQHQWSKLVSGDTLLFIVGNMEKPFVEMIKKVRQRAKHICILFIRPAQQHTYSTPFVRQLQAFGVDVFEMTERELMKTRLEVKRI